MKKGAAEHVLPVYVFDPRHFATTRFGSAKTGVYRARFLMESVQDLKSNLRYVCRPPGCPSTSPSDISLLSELFASPSVTLSVTQRALRVTQQALSVTQRALSVTQRALSVTH